MSTTTASPRPTLGDSANEEEARSVAEAFAAELQQGGERRDADLFNRHFAADVAWGSPYGATIVGYQPLHAIHERFQRAADPVVPSSRYRVVHAACPAPDVVVTHVERRAVDAAGEPTDGFFEMALYVLVRRDGEWWLAAGQNTPIRPA